MNIKVTKNTITIEENKIVNQGEYNVTSCIFLFSEEYENLIKKAIFTRSGKSYLVYIEDDKCKIPNEVLKEDGIIEIGVYAYILDENEELELRYSPTPVKKYIEAGSYKENAENSEPVTPTDKEQMEQKLNDGLPKVKKVIREILETKVLEVCKANKVYKESKVSKALKARHLP